MKVWAVTQLRIADDLFSTIERRYEDGAVEHEMRLVVDEPRDRGDFSVSL